ncbi:hypothetical protein LVD15_02890 [Fulvivirga maritima]|uniref:hypothetical protein n=1 Tax=Fulvivirga maritima TaxID=2904247 RepID=UPI001F367751|nr:hypothetical protein [Fulvivirga maritima]UII27394.1 hypothetical protein LVD15_02890 [Fulvivirga maritima]
MQSDIGYVISDVKQDLKLVVNQPPSEEILSALTTLLEKGIAVTLVVSREVGLVIENNVFLFNKCLVLLKKGAQIYVVEHDFISYAIADYQNLSIYDDAGTTPADDLTQYLRNTRSLIKGATPFLQEDNDIQIHFEVNDDIIFKDDEITLRWEVKNAQTVIIHGIGEVDHIGYKKVRPQRNTIFKLGAYNQAQTSLRTTFVSVYDDLQINYTLSAAHPKTQNYSDLAADAEGTHVYGVSKGNYVRFQWSVKDSNAVSILPFDLQGTEGIYGFLAERHTEILIEAVVHNRSVTRKIQLLVFPIKVFRDQLMLNSEALSEQLQKKIPDTAEILEEIKNRKGIYNQSLEEIRKAQEQRGTYLVNHADELIFNNYNKKCNIKSINRGVFCQLKRLFKRKPGVADVLKSMKSYYEQE